jgi:predicted phosphoribosyltransferase
MEKYPDRYEAGKILATELKSYAKRSDVIVLALPRGGVPVAYEIAKTLSLPLDVFIVRKLGVPGHEELAMGAIASGGVTVFNDEVLRDLPISKSMVDQVIQSESEELNQREIKYRGKRPFPDFTNKTIILVDDGIATGATMKAAIKALRQQKPASIIVAVPVAEYSTCQEIGNLVEKIVCPLKPHDFYAVGAWYENFSQTEDQEVYQLLKQAQTKI